MSESVLEKYLIKRVRDLGGITYKFVSPGKKGVPDRIVLLAGLVVFFELKAPGRSLSKAQTRVIAEMREQNAHVCVCDSSEQVDDAIEKILNTARWVRNKLK